MSELRKRTAGGDAAGANGAGPREQDDEKKGDAQDASAFFGKLKPAIEALIDVYTKLAPFIDKGMKAYAQVKEKVRPYYEQYYVPQMGQALLGFVLAFYGGFFAFTIACYTALQISGLRQIKESYYKIKRNYHSGMQALNTDEKARKFVDKDGDGQISSEELAQAAVRFVKGSTAEKLEALSQLRAVFVAIDPNQVMNGLVGIWTVALTVLATLRSRFAKDVALGVSLGETVQRGVEKHVKPLIVRNVDDDMKKWVEFGIQFACKSIGVSIALMLARMVSALHSSLQGGRMLALLAFQFLASKQLISEDMVQAVASKSVDLSEAADADYDLMEAKERARNDMVESNPLFLAVQFGIGLYGFFYQLRSGFVLQFWLLRLLLLPFSVVEGVLTYMAAYQ